MSLRGDGMSRRLDEVMGRRFGRLTVIGVDTKKFVAIALCDCGNIRTPRAWALLTGRQVSCGCYARENAHRDSNETLEDLLACAEVRGPDDCWEWQRARTNGYGKINFRRIEMIATRAVWIAIHGSIPEGRIICHKCDNPPCINPNHLFCGTYQDNVDDMMAKGRGRWAGGGKPWVYCRKGHLLAETEYRAPGDPSRRTCGVCMRERQRAYERRKATERRAARLTSNTSENQ